MKKLESYTYLGTNGILTTPIHLEGIHFIKKITLIADKDKQLTKDNKHFFDRIVTNDLELELWKEVDKI